MVNSVTIGEWQISVLRDIGHALQPLKALISHFQNGTNTHTMQSCPGGQTRELRNNPSKSQGPSGSGLSPTTHKASKEMTMTQRNTHEKFSFPQFFSDSNFYTIHLSSNSLLMFIVLVHFQSSSNIANHTYIPPPPSCSPPQTTLSTCHNFITSTSDTQKKTQKLS